tara:strand:- start:33 stop:674 length:642 start_codon:yes stop_codon:yes gene_type:complete
LENNFIIDIYSDTICPWCYIGLNKLKSAIKEFALGRFDLVWRPFQLNPNMPSKGMKRNEYLKIKFNGEENAKKIYKSIHQTGLLNQIHFQFNKISITPNSFASHKLLAIAHTKKKQTEVLETIFYDYFIEGVNIGNVDELIRIAKQHEIYNDNTYKYLISNKDNKNLFAEEKQARQLGISSVPCFIINKKYVLFGAQNKEKFIEIFKNIYNGK